MSLVLHKSNFVFDIKSLYAFGLYPLQSATKNISKAFVKIYTGITDIITLQDSLEAMRNRVATLEGTALEYRQLKSENDRLKKLLNDRPVDDNYELEYAEIVSKDPQNFYRTIVINKGSVDGISVGMPVIAYQNGVKGLVGKIIEVRNYYSRVLSLSDETSQISVMLETSHAAGIMSGQSLKSQEAYLGYIDRSVEVEEGERVITSGMGGVFSKGILVGTIFKVEKKIYGLFHDLYVSPVVDFSSLEDVYIIKKMPEPEVLDLAGEDSVDLSSGDNNKK